METLSEDMSDSCRPCSDYQSVACSTIGGTTDESSLDDLEPCQTTQGPAQACWTRFKQMGAGPESDS